MLFEEETLLIILESAQSYSKLCDYVYIISSDDFKEQNYYAIHFYPQNFLHLTGVKTTLKSIDFYEKALKGELSVSDFSCGSKGSSNESEKELYNHVKQKMKHLKHISSLFENSSVLVVQENFKKGKIPCCFASANGKFSMGFAGKSLQPMTLLNGNMLDPNQWITNVSVAKVKIK